jgi:hypothetical protein
MQQQRRPRRRWQWNPDYDSGNEKRERGINLFLSSTDGSASTIVCVSLWSVRRPSRHSIFRSGRKSKINYVSAYADLDPICELTRAALHYPVSGLRENYIHLQVMHRMSVSFWNCKSRTARDFIYFILWLANGSCTQLSQVSAQSRSFIRLKLQ